MKKFKKILLSGVIVLSLTYSCETTEDKKLIGGLIGAAVGAYVGSEIGSGIGKNITTVLGGSLGYLLGQKLANILSESEEESFGEKIKETLDNNENLESNQWSSDEDPSKNAIITPLSNYNYKNSVCRDFKKIVTKEKKSIEEVSKACRDKEGNWVVIETS